MNKEVRVIDALTVNLRSESKDGKSKIVGYAAVFDRDSEDMGFIEVIKPGAFRKAIKKADTRALFNHDPNLIFGRSGVNLKLREDENGLLMEVDPVDTSTYRMVQENIDAGLVTQQSFAFTVASDGAEWNDDLTRRTINEVDEIFDVSPVTYPAYPDTTVALRSRDETKERRSADPMIDDAANPPEQTPMSVDLAAEDQELRQNLRELFQTYGV